MLFLIILMAIGGGAYWLLRMRRAAELHGSVATQVALLEEQVRQLREAQWQMRTAVDALREEQDFTNQLRSSHDAVPPPPMA